MILDQIASATKVRYNKEYFELPEVQERFLDYYSACLAEVEDLGKLYNIHIPEPDKIIFGHIHEPIFQEHPIKMVSGLGKSIELYNTGGWLRKPNKLEKSYNGSVVFSLESKIGIVSKLLKVRNTDILDEN